MSVHELSDVIKSKTPSSAATGATVASPPLGRPARPANAQQRPQTISLASWASLFCFAMGAHRSMAPRSTDNIIDPAATQNALLLSSTSWLAVVRRRRCGGDRQCTVVSWLAIHSRYIFASLLNTLSLQQRVFSFRALKSTVQCAQICND